MHRGHDLLARDAEMDVGRQVNRRQPPDHGPGSGLPKLLTCLPGYRPLRGGARVATLAGAEPRALVQGADDSSPAGLAVIRCHALRRALSIIPVSDADLGSGLCNDGSVGRLQPLRDPQHSRRVPRTTFGSRLLSRFQFAAKARADMPLATHSAVVGARGFGARLSGRPIGRGKVLNAIAPKPRATGFWRLVGRLWCGPRSFPAHARADVLYVASTADNAIFKVLRARLNRHLWPQKDGLEMSPALLRFDQAAGRAIFIGLRELVRELTPAIAHGEAAIKQCLRWRQHCG
jgi:hypothetical protein